MLDAHPEIAIPDETHFLAGFLTKAQSAITRDEFFRIITEAPTWPNLVVAETSLRKALDEVEPFSVSGGIRAFYQLYAALSGKSRWGDKTPPYRNHMVGIERLLPEAHFIHIIRDGRDAALSYRGLWFGPGDDIEAQAKFWVEQIHSAQSQAQKLRNYVEVRYEQLVTDPETTLRRLCDYLKLSFHSRMLEYYKFASSRLAECKRPIGPPGRLPADVKQAVSIHDRTKQPPLVDRIGRWRAEMPVVDQRLYEAIAGPMLRELGYDTVFHYE